MFLLQFDACTREHIGLSSIGYVIYFNDVVIYEESFIINEKIDSTSAEYLALIYGLKTASILNIKQLYIEGDAKIVIDQINKICKVHFDKIQFFLNNIENLKKKFNFIKFYHIYRKYNVYADSLANYALIQHFSEKKFIEHEKPLYIEDFS